MRVGELFRAAQVPFKVLFPADSGEESEVGPGFPVSSVSADSREADSETLFVALPGTKVDGHDFLSDAVARGCRLLLVEEGKEELGATLMADLSPQPLCLSVSDTRWAFGRLSAALHGFPAGKMVMVGITGTNGKTTASYLLEALIACNGGVPGVIGTVNYRYRGRVVPASHTTPEPQRLQRLLREMVQEGVTHVVMEVSSHALEQQRVAGIEFDVALFTNLSHEHLDYHGDMEAYFAGKKKLFTNHLKAEGKAVVAAVGTADMAAVVTEQTGDGKDICDYRVNGVIGHGASQDVALRGRLQADYWNRRLIDELREVPLPPEILRSGFAPGELQVKSVRTTLRGIEIHLDGPGREWNLNSSLVGDFNVDNLLAVAGVGLALGYSTTEISAGLAQAPPPPGRLERLSSARGFEVFVDYAHTPDALSHVLSALRRITRGRLIVVFGCGGERDRGKRPSMGRIAASLADVVVLTSDNPRGEEPGEILAAIEAGVRATGTRRCRLEYLLGGELEMSVNRATQAAPPSDRRQPGPQDHGQARRGIQGCRGYDLLPFRRRAIRESLYYARPGDVIALCGKGHESGQIIRGVSYPFDDRQEVRRELAVLK